MANENVPQILVDAVEAVGSIEILGFIMLAITGYLLVMGMTRDENQIVLRYVFVFLAFWFFFIKQTHHIGCYFCVNLLLPVRLRA